MERLDMDTMQARMNLAGTIPELRALRDQCHEMFHGHLFTLDTAEWNKLLNRLHDLIIQRAIRLTEQQMADEGWGEPPVPYAFVLFGSGGRQEQTLWSDQDNSIIYDNIPESEKSGADKYFAELGNRIERNLEMAGYPPCDGNVLCSNDQWRKPLDDWLGMMGDWFADPVWENVRYLLIIADARCVYGDEQLLRRVKRKYAETINEYPAFLHYMLKNTLHHKVSIGLFGHLIKERYGEDAGGVDFKYGAYIPMVNGIRLLAVQAGIGETGTLQRLDGIIGSGVHAPVIMECAHVFKSVLKLRSMTPFEEADGIYRTRGYLYPGDLDKSLLHELKHCLRTGMELQKFVKKQIETRHGKRLDGAR